MTRILTVSSGRATPKVECMACASQGLSGIAIRRANGARTSPSSEMLAPPSRKAIQTLVGEPGWSPAAITIHNIKSAGTTAAVPMTVGRLSNMLIAMHDMSFFDSIHCRNRGRRVAAGVPAHYEGRIRVVQQPRQMPFIRALTRSSSEPVESTDCEESGLGTGGVRGKGGAGVRDVSGGAS